MFFSPTAIFISVSGFAEVRWSENVEKQNSEGKPETVPETFSSHEMYYSSENSVYGQSGGAQLELPAGKYIFPFQATIPPNAPTSFNGSSGQIQHEVTLTIDRSMRYDNTFKQAYTVISPYDLNLNPNNSQPLHKIEEKTFCWGLCCGTKGPMVMTVNVPYSAYAPGQKIRFNIVLDNQSDVNCSDVKVRLMKKVVYTSRTPEVKTQETEIKVADNHCGEVVKLNKAEFNEFLQIPATTPTSLESCTIIKVSYTLKFIAKVFRLLGDLVIEFPLAIGTVPLYASTVEPGPITAQPSAGPVYKPLPPPTFEEDVRSEQFESNTYKPRYPVFLADGNLTNGSHSTTNPQQSNNLYPIPPISTHPPHVNPIPKPVAMPNPMPVPAPAITTAPSPARATAPASVPPVATKARSEEDPLEVLGFSIPPDYKPTPSAPPSNDNSNVGWK
ncbi:arrestin domain-containing protein 1-like [Teleopsis dalmanni]|uniref:arrestin domain-containing protein 1-like n=1 Tax=Teleopsis dalmanni TaxID=139649 RepID=UPI0018CF2666|nr:arrestin domain-containing protein 1-like [Teleopsis dalmanni]